MKIVAHSTFFLILIKKSVISLYEGQDSFISFCSLLFYSINSNFSNQKS